MDDYKAWMITYAKNKKDDSDQAIQKKGENMMKKLMQNKSSAFLRGVFAVVTLGVFWITMAPFGAEAALQGSAGNTIIKNTVTVNYKDNNGNAQTPVTSSVSITVNTVAVAPTVLSFTPSPGSTDGTGATQAYTVMIRTNSNGPGTITFGTADGTFANVVAGTAPTVPGSISLGSTIIDPTDSHIGNAQTVAAAGSITFAVPNDGNGPGSVINGLSSGETVYLYSGTTYYGPFTVGTVTDVAVGGGTTAAPGSIQLVNNTGASIGPFTPQYGWELLQAAPVTVTVTQGAVTNPALAASWVTTVTATMGGLNGTGTVTTNAHSGQLTVQKYVRDVTTPVTGATPITLPAGIGGATYYQTGVSGKPGDILEYAVVITDSGTGNATVVTATDPVPTYSTLVSSSGAYGANNTGGLTGTFAEVYSSRTGTMGSIKINNSGGLANVGYGQSTGTAAGSTMTFYLGIGSTTSAGGTVNSAEVDDVIYQVTIN
jgi:hypothetical protein